MKVFWHLQWENIQQSHCFTPKITENIQFILDIDQIYFNYLEKMMKI